MSKVLDDRYSNWWWCSQNSMSSRNSEIRQKFTDNLGNSSGWDYRRWPMRNEPFVGLESVPMETRSRRSGPFHLDLYSARLLLGSTAKKSTADSFLSPSPRNSISTFFQRRISSSFLSLFSFFLPFLYFSPSISFFPSRTPSSPPFPSPPPEVSTGL